jgi:hypothetical protein
MDRRAAWILGLVFGGLFLCLFAFMALAWVAIQGGRAGTSWRARAETGWASWR